MQYLDSDSVVYDLDQTRLPLLTVEPGERFEVATLDARAGAVISGSLCAATGDIHSNPATGPVAVAGAQPGDILAVHIENITLGTRGYTRCRPGRGSLGNQLQHTAGKILDVTADCVEFAPALRLACRPMLGGIAVTPAGRTVPSVMAGDYGGNMDYVGSGPASTVYLTVQVPGALLYLSDAHALMGAGELTGTALEISAVTQITVDLLAGCAPLPGPVVATRSKLAFIAVGDDVEDAIRRASMAAVTALMQRHRLAFEDAYLLLGLLGDGVLCQTCFSPVLKPIVCVEIAREYLTPWPCLSAIAEDL